MARLFKRVDSYIVDSEMEAENFIAELKADPENEGYELKSYKRVKKEKKSKGEVIDEWYVIEATKTWEGR